MQVTSVNQRSEAEQVDMVSYQGKQQHQEILESELAALYIMAREAVYFRIILEEMGHKQPPTSLQTDNSMADAVCNGKI